MSSGLTPGCGGCRGSAMLTSSGVTDSPGPTHRLRRPGTSGPEIRYGWAEAFRAMAGAEDDALRDPVADPTERDEEEWEC